MINVITIVVVLILIYIVYNFMYSSTNKSSFTNGEAIVPKRTITNLEEELRRQYENNRNGNSDVSGNGNVNGNDNSNNNGNDNGNNNGNDSNLSNDGGNDLGDEGKGKSSLNYDDLSEKIIKEKDGIIVGVIDKTVDSGKESLPENIQGVKMVQENKKSNFMMEKNMPYIDLENDMINLSLLPELRT